MLRPEKSRLPSQPLAAPQASVAMATAERLAPMRAAGGKDGEALRGPAWPLQHHPSTWRGWRWSHLPSWLLRLCSPTYQGLGLEEPALPSTPLPALLFWMPRASYSQSCWGSSRLLAFILTFVYSANVRGALNQALCKPILRAGAAALPQPSQSKGGSCHPCPSLFQVPGSQTLQSIISLRSHPTKIPTSPSMDPVQRNVSGGPSSTRRGALEHEGSTPRWAELPGLCPASSGRLCHPGIQHCVTHAWKMHKGCRGGTAVHHDRGTRGVFTPWKQPFLTPLILWAERNALCFIKIVSAFYDSCHSLDPELAASPAGKNLHPLQNNIISLYILEHTKDATQQNRSCPKQETVAQPRQAPGSISNPSLFI